jgi:hypothetical protein
MHPPTPSSAGNPSGECPSDFDRTVVATADSVASGDG